MNTKELQRLSALFMAEFQRLTVKEEKERAMMIALDLAELSFMKVRNGKTGGPPKD